MADAVDALVLALSEPQNVENPAPCAAERGRRDIVLGCALSRMRQPSATSKPAPRSHFTI
jgi:hypothetical protein